MTMFSSENRAAPFISGGYGGAIYGEGFVGVMSQLQGIYTTPEQDDEGEEEIRGYRSDIMAEEESRTESSLNESSSKDHQRETGGDGDEDQEWLQLGIGGRSSLRRPIKHDLDHRHHHHLKDSNGSGLVELELMPSSSGIDYSNNNNNNNSSSSNTIITRPEFRAPRPVMNFTGPSAVFGTTSSYFLQQQQYYNSGFPTPPPASSSGYINPHQEFNWGFRPMMSIPINTNFIASNSSPSPSPAALMAGSYFARPVQFYGGTDTASGQGPGGDLRVIQPPKRPHSGIWFMLQASQNQEKEPFLPQISKSYLRIKDGRMTIRLVIKYLVNKLRLENESEIEITCRGQKLVPFLTLQHVRDNIWSNSRDFITLLPNSSTAHHIMVLHYARTASNS